MTRESIDQKAVRLLASGALQVLEVDAGQVRAVCQGDSGRTWRLGWHRGRWGCQCPAGQFGASCAHLVALRKVCAGPTREPAGLTAERLREAQREATAVRNGTARRSA